MTRRKGKKNNPYSALLLLIALAVTYNLFEMFNFPGPTASHSNDGDAANGHQNIEGIGTLRVQFRPSQTSTGRHHHHQMKNAPNDGDEENDHQYMESKRTLRAQLHPSKTRDKNEQRQTERVKGLRAKSLHEEIPDRKRDPPSRPRTVRDLNNERKCWKYFESPRPLYTEEDYYEKMRKVYEEQNGIKLNHIEANKKPMVPPPFRAAQTIDGKGRGLFAIRDIKKGELVYSGSHQYAFFETGEAYRRFIDALADDVACDILKWAYVQSHVGGDYDALIAVTMGDASLVNNGGSDSNLGCPKNMECGFNEYALTDIKEGEEIVSDYSAFVPQDDDTGNHGWDWFGL